MDIDRYCGKALILLALLTPGLAHGQVFPGCGGGGIGGGGIGGLAPVGGGIAVADAATELNTFTIGQSVTTATTATFNGTNDLFSVISPQTFLTEFPGWQRLPANSRDIAMANTMHALSTYLAAAADAQTRSQGLPALIQASNGGQVLAAIQTQTIITANLVQLVADLVQIEAVEHAEQLNEKARAQATQSATWTEWAQGLIGPQS